MGDLLLVGDRLGVEYLLGVGDRLGVGDLLGVVYRLGVGDLLGVVDRLGVGYRLGVGDLLGVVYRLGVGDLLGVGYRLGVGDNYSWSGIPSWSGRSAWSGKPSWSGRSFWSIGDRIGVGEKTVDVCLADLFPVPISTMHISYECSMAADTLTFPKLLLHLRGKGTYVIGDACHSHGIDSTDNSTILPTRV